METITEDYVSFEIAKLLKERGFLKGVDLRITQNLSFYDDIGLHHNLNKYYNSLILDKIDFVVAPTHQMAMKWLREKDIFIGIIPQEIGVGITGITYTIDKMTKNLWLPIYQNKGFDSYEEAVESALKYTLENLI